MSSRCMSRAFIQQFHRYLQVLLTPGLSLCLLTFFSKPTPCARRANDYPRILKLSCIYLDELKVSGLGSILIQKSSRDGIDNLT